MIEPAFFVAYGRPVSDRAAPSHRLSPQLVAAVIVQLLDEQRAALAELHDGPCGWAPMRDLSMQVLQERIDWLEEELTMRLPPGPG
jgi:phosphoglycerate-specific signal transduction histidine kinase